METKFEGQYRACTCALGECKRAGHRPERAACGHPGFFGFAGSLSYCHRPECKEAAQVASAILALTRE